MHYRNFPDECRCRPVSNLLSVADWRRRPLPNPHLYLAEQASVGPVLLLSATGAAVEAAEADRFQHQLVHSRMKTKASVVGLLEPNVGQEQPNHLRPRPWPCPRFHPPSPDRRAQPQTPTYHRCLHTIYITQKIQQTRGVQLTCKRGLQLSK